MKSLALDYKFSSTKQLIRAFIPLFTEFTEVKEAVEESVDLIEIGPLSS